MTDKRKEKRTDRKKKYRRIHSHKTKVAFLVKNDWNQGEKTTMLSISLQSVDESKVWYTKGDVDRYISLYIFILVSSKTCRKKEFLFNFICKI